MAKGPLVTDAVEAVIAVVYREHPKWKAPMVRNEVDYILHRKKPDLPPGWPSLNSVQKVLATIRKKEKGPDPQDKPWSTATLDNYPIPPEALSIVLKVWKFHMEKGHFFHIRDAKWAARLSAVNPVWRIGQDLDKLALLARRYSITELVFDRIERDFDSTEVDRSLMGLPVGVSNFNSFLLAIIGPALQRGLKRVLSFWSEHPEAKDLNELIEIEEATKKGVINKVSPVTPDGTR